MPCLPSPLAMMATIPKQLVVTKWSPSLNGGDAFGLLRLSPSAREDRIQPNPDIVRSTLNLGWCYSGRHLHCAWLCHREGRCRWMVLLPFHRYGLCDDLSGLHAIWTAEHYWARMFICECVHVRQYFVQEHLFSWSRDWIRG
jgi:hypothetical protein